MIRYGYTKSPLLLMVIGLILLEVFYRLPIIIYYSTLDYSEAFDNFVFFSDYRATDVILIGMLISITGFLAIWTGFVLANKRAFLVRSTLNVDADVTLGILFALLVAVLIAAGFLAIIQIGWQEIAGNLSSKRAIIVEGEGYRLYVFFKLALLLHIPGFILFAWYCSNPDMKRLVAVAAVSFGILFFAMVFSQRQIIFLYFLELIYVAFVFKRLSKKVFVIGAIAMLSFLIFVTATRGYSDGVSLFDAIQKFNEKIIGSRYFFDFTRHGVIWLWESQNNLNPILIFGSPLEIINADYIVNGKNFGREVASNAYWKYNPGGVTTGSTLDAILQFGFIFGYLFILIFGTYFAFLERHLLLNHFSVIGIVLVGKVIIFLNTGFDSFVFATLVDLPFAVLFTLTISITKTVRDEKI